MACQKVAMVTGANRGISFAIVKGLCKEFDRDVYLTARDEEKGAAAVKALETGLKPKFYFVDVEDKKSIQSFHNMVVEKYGGIDVVIDNAGVQFR